MELCPHCGATSTSEPSRALRAVCGVCGGARIPRMKLGVGTTAKLARAKSERTRQVAATLVTVALVAMALFVGSVALLAAATAHGAAAFIAAALGAVDFAMAMAAWGYAKKRGAASRDALDEAWAAAAARIARAHGGEITARELASKLKTSDADADAILAKLSAGGARVEVDDDAELHYRVDAVDAADPQSRSSDASAAGESAGDPPASAERREARR